MQAQLFSPDHCWLWGWELKRAAKVHHSMKSKKATNCQPAQSREICPWRLLSWCQLLPCLNILLSLNQAQQHLRAIDSCCSNLENLYLIEGKQFDCCFIALLKKKKKKGQTKKANVLKDISGPEEQHPLSFTISVIVLLELGDHCPSKEHLHPRAAPTESSHQLKLMFCKG